ncbi:sugar nucleotide-binding protein, partial [Klebsiella variicola]
EIFALSAASGGPSATVEPIASSEYPTPARRPTNSRLSTDKLTRDYAIAPRPWRAAVAEIVN